MFMNYYGRINSYSWSEGTKSKEITIYIKAEAMKKSVIGALKKRVLNYYFRIGDSKREVRLKDLGLSISEFLSLILEEDKGLSFYFDRDNNDKFVLNHMSVNTPSY